MSKGAPMSSAAPAEGVEQRPALRLEAAEEGEDAVARLLDADHGRTSRAHGVIRSRSGGPLPAVNEAKRGEPPGGGGALDAGDLLDGVGDRVSEAVEVVRFELHDHVVRPGYGVDRGDARAG